ncbi:MAG: GNAT family N-acetyltransferase [Cecembia sp.]
MKKTIETERLWIRPIGIDDHAFMYNLVNSEGWLKYIGDRDVTNLEAAKEYIQAILKKPDFHYYALDRKLTGESIGIVSFIKRERQEHPDFGFALLPEFQKQGFAHESSLGFLKAIQEEFDYPEILGITLSYNLASIKLLERLGFQWTMNKSENGEILAVFSLCKNTANQ